jgi:hypothetical protein
MMPLQRTASRPRTPIACRRRVGKLPASARMNTVMSRTRKTMDITPVAPRKTTETRPKIRSGWNSSM